MSAPATHGQLRAELDAVETRTVRKLDALETRIIGVDGKVDALEIRMLGVETRIIGVDGKVDALETRIIGVDGKVDTLEVRFDAKLELWAGALHARIRHDLTAMEQRMYAEIARLTRSIAEMLSGQLAVVDEKYKDLPARVTQLELAADKRGR